MFKGTVIHGDKVGRKMGFPTANLDIPPEKTKLKDGIYAVHVILDNIRYHAAAYIHRARQRVEIHLLEYGGEDFYGEQLNVDPIQKVSEVTTVTDAEELQKKVAHDVELVKGVFYK